MNRFIKLLLVMSFIGVATTGCASGYTNVEPLSEGTYRVTQLKAGFFRVKGVLLECEAQGKTMRCKEIAVE